MSASPAAAAAAPAAAAPALAPQHTLLYLANLSFALTAEQLTAFVQKETGAQITGVTIVTRKGKEGPRSRGIGFAQVPNAKLDAVLGLNGKDLEGRALEVQVAKVQVPGGGEREPRVKKEKAPAQPRAPREPQADGSAPADKPARKRKGRKGAANGGAAAAGADGSAAAAAPAPRAPKASKRQSTIAEPGYTLLYVNNLSFDASQEEVSGLFSGALGEAPKTVELVLSKYGRFKDRSRGFAFVQVRNEQVEKALALNGTQFQERDVGVAVAKDKQEQQAQ